MSSPPLHLMAIFAYVVDANGFSAAARRLGLSKSAVSKAITELEEHLGTRLLQRTTRSLRLTDAGTRFYTRCSRIVREAEQAELEVGRLDGRPRGKVRINAPIVFGRRFVLPVVLDLLSKHPDVEVELTLQDDYVDLVATGTDLAVRVGRVLGSSLVAKKIATVRGLLVASPDYLAKHGTPKEPHELADHQIIIYTYVSRPSELVLARDAERVTVKVAGALSTNNGEALIDAAVAGQGIGFTPDFLGLEELCSGKVVPVLREWTSPELAVYLVYAEAGPVTPAVRLLIDSLTTKADAVRKAAGVHPFGMALAGLVDENTPQICPEGAAPCPGAPSNLELHDAIDVHPPLTYAPLPEGSNPSK